MSHLGRWLTALVDGEVDDVERDRLLNHLARCDACRREANELRSLKRRMTALGEASTDPMLTGRLIERARYNAGGTAHLEPQPAAFPPWGDRSGIQIWKVAAASVGAALVTVGAAAFLLGGARPATPGPVVTPAVDVFWLQHDFDAGQVPAAAPTPAPPASPPAGLPTHTSAPQRR